MVKHIVMFKLKDKTAENLDKAVSALKGLAGNIETLKFLEVGTDYLGSESSYDIVLTTHFDDKEGLDVYRTHKNHIQVVNLIKELCLGSVVVDYEI